MSFENEQDFIQKILKPLTLEDDNALGLEDDVAILPEVSRDEVLVVTKDAIAVGVHTLENESPEFIARKALRVNLSDLASMGADPLGFLMALCLGKDNDEEFIQSLVAGLQKDVSFFNIPLIGGDIIRKPGPLTISITAIGSVKKNLLLLRSKANQGDSIWVSGTIGDSALGLKVLKNELGFLTDKKSDFLINRFRLPIPRITLGRSLLSVADACVDLSDGIISDIGKMCKASGLGCTLEFSCIPLSESTKTALDFDEKLAKSILNGGDDYELAFSIKPEREVDLIRISKSLALPITRIGTVTHDVGVNIQGLPQKIIPFSKSGYDHI